MPRDGEDSSIRSALRQRYSQVQLLKIFYRAQIIVLVLTGLLVFQWVATSTRGYGLVEIITAFVTIACTLATTFRSVQLPTALPLWSLILQVVTAGTVFVVNFSWIYWAYSPSPSACMNVGLSKIDGTYFTLTTLTTVGYGDITPVTERCRVIVSGQLILGIVFMVIILSLLIVRIADTTIRRRV